MNVNADYCRLVGLDGLEPSTSRLSGVRSSHLSYRPSINFSVKFDPQDHLIGRGNLPLVEMRGLEPLTPCLQSRCSPN